MNRIFALALTTASLMLASCECCKTKKTDSCCTSGSTSSCCSSDVGKLKVGAYGAQAAH